MCNDDNLVELESKEQIAFQQLRDEIQIGIGKALAKIIYHVNPEHPLLDDGFHGFIGAAIESCEARWVRDALSRMATEYNDPDWKEKIGDNYTMYFMYRLPILTVQFKREHEEKMEKLDKN